VGGAGAASRIDDPASFRRMASKRYVALLRGINVGGRNKVPMGELRQAFEDGGYDAVRTYIQSGNVLFESAAARQTLEGDIERVLEERFGVPLVVVVRSRDQLRAVVERAPDGFGAAPATFHSDVLFLKAPLTPRQALRVVQCREGVDEAWAGTGVLYFARRSALRTKSKMSSIVGTPEYQRMTIRSWATTTTLLGLLDEAASA
jgi:uncharacterized protein (DUF1697 family)